ncbi:uncharacterized protein LOC108905263 [Anoplophora glabripennis]|uniref:uncharacterized protein LOC108905263 n=1 Tax=Anoplophora glabripennis TaxID=217634 RepID=UPI000873E89E|nr:uncharacterized protein LOC108905263 [Anoplophora glabripennis]
MEFRKLTLLKFLELAIAIACIGLHYKTRTNDFDTDTLSCTSFGGYIIILIGTIAGVLMGTPISRRIYIFYCLVGCATFVGAGALNIEIMKHWGKSELRDYGFSKAILAIINGFVFLADALVEWREY